MKMQKYRDMAYSNNRGRAWLRLIYSQKIWNKWCKKVSDLSGPKWFRDKNRPEKILTEAIWHFGYARDRENSPTVRATARRLRRSGAPPERGVGESKGDPGSLNGEISAYGMPVEFWLLENFLENEVRPRMEGATKIE